MATGATILGSAAVISVAPNTGTEAAPVAGTYAPISDLNTIGKNSTRNVTSLPVFMRATSYQIAGSRDQTLSLGGYLSAADTGQDQLHSAEAANVIVFIKILFDGTNGFSQPVRVGSKTYGATPDGLQTVTFALTSAGSATVVGTGPAI